MPVRGKSWQRFGRLNGSDAGRSARKVWVCQACGTWHYNGIKAGCMTCGVLAVFDYFHSEGEAKRWARLQQNQRAGYVRNLRRQVPFPLMTVGPAGLPVKWAEYVSDFVYDERDPKTDEWSTIVEDYKPAAGASPDAVLKIRCLEAQGIRVRVMTKDGEV